MKFRVDAMRLFLACILLVGAFVRLYALNHVPTELVADELELYNSAHSILTTGHDVDGLLLPFTYGPLTRNPPLYAFAGYASAQIFGKSAFALRLPAAIFGLASIVLIYLITVRATRRRYIGIIAALLQSISPVFIQFSRIAWEPSCELPFILGGIYGLMLAVPNREEKTAIRWTPLVLGCASMGVACYTYMAAWFYAAALAATFLMLNWRRLRPRQNIGAVAAGICLWGIIAAPALWMWFGDAHTTDRTTRIATFGHGINASSLQTFAQNYIAHFRWDFLARNGHPIAGITWRYLKGFGAFYWWELSIALVGLLYIKTFVTDKPTANFLRIWLLLYPLGGALTNEGAPNAPRTLAGMPVLCILGAIGWACMRREVARLELPRKLRAPSHNLMWYAPFAAGAISLTLFSLYYFGPYVHQNSNAWDSGTRNMFAAVERLSPRYKRVCFAVHPAFYAIATYARFYLGDKPQTDVIETLNDARCALPQTLIVADDSQHLSLRTYEPVAVVRDVDGSIFAKAYVPMSRLNHTRNLQ